jgi:hypothetical protein
VVVEDILGVVNEFTPVPPDKGVPPVAAAYQSMVSPEPAAADIVTVPVPQREPPVPLGTDGLLLMVAVTVVRLEERQPVVVFLASAK